MSVLSILVKHQKFWPSLSFVDVKDCVIYVTDLIVAFPFTRIEFLCWQYGIDLPFLFILKFPFSLRKVLFCFRYREQPVPKQREASCHEATHASQTLRFPKTNMRFRFCKSSTFQALNRFRSRLPVCVEIAVEWWVVTRWKNAGWKQNSKI